MSSERRVHRRDLLRAVGWSVPVIAVAVATPAAAASTASQWTASDFDALVPRPNTGQPDYLSIGATLTDQADPGRSVPEGTTAVYLIDGEPWDPGLGFIIDGSRINGGGMRPSEVHIGDEITITATYSLPDGSTADASGVATVQIA